MRWKIWGFNTLGICNKNAKALISSSNFTISKKIKYQRVWILMGIKYQRVSNFTISYLNILGDGIELYIALKLGYIWDWKFSHFNEYDIFSM